MYKRVVNELGQGRLILLTAQVRMRLNIFLCESSVRTLKLGHSHDGNTPETIAYVSKKMIDLAQKYEAFDQVDSTLD